MSDAAKQKPFWRNTRWLPALALVAFAGVLALYAVAVGMAGGSVAGLFLYPLAFAAGVWLPGLWLAGWALPGAGFPVRAVAAVPLGGVAVMLLFQLIGLFAPPVLVFVPTVALGGWHLYQNREKIRRPRLAQVPAGWWWLLILFSAALLLYVFSGVFASAKPHAAGTMVYNQDLLWSMGNAGAAAYGAPVRDLRAAGGVLHYHYFTDVLSGLLALLSGQANWDAMAFYAWPIWCAFLLGAVYLIARGFGAGPCAALLAPGGVLLAHTSWETSFRHMFVNVNGVVQSNFLLAAAILMVQAAAGDGYKNKRSLVALLAASTALVWGKSTIGVLFVCALAAALIVGGILRKKLNRWLLAAALGSAALFAAAYLLIYRHAINNLVFQPSASAVGDALGILFYRYLPGLVVYLVSLVFALKDFKKLTDADLLVHALVPGGVVAYVLFYHYSFSQSYFLLAACFAMWLCAARVAGYLFSKKALAAATAALCVYSTASTAYYAEPVLRHGAQAALRCAGLRPAFPEEEESCGPNDEAAAAWLRANMKPDEVFATNRNAKSQSAGEGVFHYYTAASGRQAFVESWRYAMDYSVEYHTLRRNLEVASDGMFAAETFAEARKIAAENGVRYLLVYRPFGAEGWPEAEPVFATDTVAIYDAAPQAQ